MHISLKNYNMSVPTIIRSGLFLPFLLLITLGSYSQDSKKGKIIEQKILSTSIQGNRGGEDPMRVTIYLPPGYQAGEQRYLSSISCMALEPMIYV